MTDSYKEFEAVKQIIRSLLISTTNKVTTETLLRDYREMTGETLPFRKLGYSDAVEFLREMSDVVRMEYDNSFRTYTLRVVADSSTRHIQKLVAKQKRPPHQARYSAHHARNNAKNIIPVPRFSRHIQQEIQVALPYQIKKDILNLLEAYPNGIRLISVENAFSNKYGTSIDFRSYGFTSLEQCLHSIAEIIFEGGNVLKLKFTQNFNRQAPPSKYVPEKDVPPAEASKPIETMEEILSNSAVNDAIKANIRKVLSREPNGVWLADFADEYKKTIGYPLDIHELGFFNLIEFVNALPDVIFAERPNSSRSDYLLHDTRTWEKKEIDSESAAAKLCEEALTNIEHILEGSSNGISLIELENVYLMNCCDSIPWKRCGYRNLREFLLISNKIQVESETNGDSYVYLKRMMPAGIKPVLKSRRYLEQESLKKMSEMKILLDIVDPSSEFVQQNLPLDTDSNSYIPVHVANAVTPDEVYIQFDEFSKAFEDLTYQMNETYYAPNNAEYKMPDSQIIIGNICAALWVDQDWYRSKIIGLPNPSTAEIYYVDYGNCSKVNRENLRFLKRDFYLLPAQAVKTRLKCLKPRFGVGWSELACTRLRALTLEKSLVCQFHESEDGLSVYLCDTSDEDKDIHINDELVKEGHADWNRDESPVIDNSEEEYEAEELRHLTPEMIEKITATDAELNSCTDILQPAGSGSSCTDDSEEFMFSEEDDDEFIVSNIKTIEEETERVQKRYVKRLYLDDGYRVHVINHKDKLYMSNGDVASLFWREADIEMLYRRLRLKGLILNSTLLSLAENAELFNQLICFDVRGIKDENEVMPAVKAYPLDCVLEILDAFGHPSDTLRKELHEEIALFEPHGVVWTKLQNISDDKPWAPTVKYGDISTLCLDDLKVTLQGLEYRRCKMIQEMTKHDISKYVEHFKAIQSKKDQVLNRIKELEEKFKIENIPVVSETKDMKEKSEESKIVESSTSKISVKDTLPPLEKTSFSNSVVLKPKLAAIAPASVKTLPSLHMMSFSQPHFPIAQGFVPRTFQEYGVTVSQYPFSMMRQFPTVCPSRNITESNEGNFSSFPMNTFYTSYPLANQFRPHMD